MLSCGVNVLVALVFVDLPSAIPLVVAVKLHVADADAHLVGAIVDCGTVGWDECERLK